MLPIEYYSNPDMMLPQFSFPTPSPANSPNYSFPVDGAAVMANYTEQLYMSQPSPYHAQAHAYFQQLYHQPVYPFKTPNPSYYGLPSPNYQNWPIQNFPTSIPSENGEVRKTRTPFTEHQLEILTARFAKNESILKDERAELAKIIGLTPTQIKIWFQNRRFKLRKEKKAALAEDEVKTVEKC